MTMLDEPITDAEIAEALGRGTARQEQKIFPKWKMTLIATGVVLVVMSIALTIILSILNIKDVDNLTLSMNRHHVQTVQQDDTIKAILSQHSSTIDEVKKIALQEEKVDSQLPAADAVLYAEVVYLNSCVYHLSLGTQVACSAPPNLKGP